MLSMYWNIWGSLKPRENTMEVATNVLCNVMRDMVTFGTIEVSRTSVMILQKRTKSKSVFFR